MLSYQHGYHAGGRADVLKHAILHALLSDANAKRGKLETVCYLETHSGRGIYDLTSPLFSKTGEAREGVLDLVENYKQGGALDSWLADYGTTAAYNGSPSIARNIFQNPSDRFVFIEKHSTEYKSLQENFQQKNTRLIKGDGYVEALRISPRRSEKLIVFVDPAFETIDDLETMSEWVPRALHKWPKAQIIIWLPRFLDEREIEFGQWLASLERGFVAGASWGAPPEGKDTALIGSAVIGYRVSPRAAKQATRIAAQLDAYWNT